MPAFSPLEIMLYNLIFVALSYGAIILQKAGAMNEVKFGEEKGLNVMKALVKNKVWLAGIVVNAISIPYATFLFSISSLSFVMILNRAGMVIIFLYAFVTLKEKITKNEIVSLIILYSGFVLVLFFLQAETTESYTGDLQGLLFFIMCGAMYGLTFIGFKRNKTHVKLKEVTLSLGAGFSGIGGMIALKVIPVVLARDLAQPGYIFNLLDIPELFRVLTGIFMPGGGYFWGSIYFFIYAASFSLNFLFVTTMYQHGRASVTIPLFNSINFLGTIIAGYFLFYEPLEVFSWIGISMMIAGIVLASKVEKKMRYTPKNEGMQLNETPLDPKKEPEGDSPTRDQPGT